MRLLIALLLVLLAGMTIWSGITLVQQNKNSYLFIQTPTASPTFLNSPAFSLLGDKPLIVGGDNAYPPFSYLENGKAAGFDNDLMREIAKNIGVNVEFHLTSWEEAKQNLLDGKIDVIGGMAYSTQREKDFAFGTPHSVSYYDLFVRRDSPIITIENIDGKSIIVQEGNILLDYLEEIGFNGEIITAPNPVEALTWLASGKHDGALLNKVQGYYLIKENHLGNIRGLGEVIKERDYGFAVVKKNRDLLLKMNQGMAIVEASGAYDELSRKWLTMYEQASFLDRSQYIIYGLVALLTVFLLVILWSWSLRRQVKRRTQELRTSEEKYRQLINNATEGVVVVKDQLLVYLNPQAASILGYPGEAQEKLSLADIIHPLDLDMVINQYRNQVINEADLTRLSFRILASKGATRWVRMHVVRIDWENQPAILAFFSDITEERNMEEILRSSEERYRLVFAQSPVGLFYYDNEMRITNVNDRMLEIMQSSREWQTDFNLNTVTDTRILPAIRAALEHTNGYYEGPHEPDTTNKPLTLYIKLQTTPLLNEKLEYQGGIGLVEDITDQVMSEHKIKNLEEKFTKAFLTSPDSININRLSDGVFIDINRGFTDVTGYTRQEVIGKSSLDINLWVNPDDRAKLVEGLREKGEYKNLEAPFRFKNGQVRIGLMSASIIEIEGEPCILSITRDIDDIKKSDELIRKSEIRYRSIFESVPASIWEQDYLKVYDMLEGLRAKGVKDLLPYLKAHPEFVDAAVRSVNIVDCNDASLKIFKAKSKDELYLSLDKFFGKEPNTNFENELLAIWDKQPFYEGETVNHDLNGERIFVNVNIRIPEKRDDFSRVLVSITDITDRKRSEEALQESEGRYRQLVEQINVVVYLDYFGYPSRPKYVSPQITTLFGYTPEEWMQDPDLLFNVIHPDDREIVMAEDTSTDLTGETFIVEYRAFTRDGQMKWIHDEAVLVRDKDGNPEEWHGVMYDITLRKKAEEALRESEKRYKTIFNSVPVSIMEEDFSCVMRLMDELRQSGVNNLEGFLIQNPDWIKKAAESVKITEVNQETLKMFKAESKEQLIRSLPTFLAEETYKSFKQEILAFWNHKNTFENETTNRTITGETIDVWVSVTLPQDSADYSRTLVTIMDITERKKSEAQIMLQIRYLAALRAVDMAISASMDLPITLRVLLNQVTQQLVVDAASILLLDPHTQTLKFSAGIGFPSPAVEATSLRLGQSYAGQAALERRMIFADDLATTSSRLLTKEFKKDNFSNYIGVPLVSKGIVKGVLELFNRSPFFQDPAWISLLESMAGQAAIAIENAMLLDEVQKVNINLRSAYDATLEGWARSLELRDGDTGSHSKRVADLTIELAQTAGYQGEGLLHIRRGALLHDIGKMGIPDSILLKPGPLTEEEWVTMRTHPAIGKRLLNSIDFLQPAIEIPYCHHERWDGKGYPEGLNGTQIPFAARVFAVVDCWDTLRSDRPWRKAWTDEKAWQYIESNSGKAYDPQIVEKFRELLGHD